MLSNVPTVAPAGMVMVTGTEITSPAASESTSLVAAAFEKVAVHPTGKVSAVTVVV